MTEPDPNGKPAFVTDISYNQAGLITKIVQHGREGDVARVRSFTYDEKGHVTSATSPEAGTTTYTYDSDGNMASKKDALGQTVTYSWDAKKRLISKTFTDDTAASSFQYQDNTLDRVSYLNVSGQRQSMREYRYDSKGRLTALSMRTSGKDGARYTLGFHYDESHRVKTITYPDGTEIQQTFTSTGLLKSVSHGKTILFSKPEYLVPSGRIKAVKLGDGISLSREYDRHNRVQRMVVTSAAGPLLDESFEYTDWGSVRRLTDNLKPSSDMRFGYDELQRVKTSDGAVDEGYVYDSFGNRALKAAGAASQAFDEHNRLTGGTGISYDAAGHVTNDGLHSYRYDGNGLIASVDGGSIRYFYDAEGNRIRKRLADGDHDYLWWNDQLLAERAPDGTWTDYVYVNGGRFASVHKAGTNDDSAVEVEYFVTGGVGTSRMKLSAEGKVLARGRFGAFGTPASPNSEAAADISFSDEVHDPETGLDTYKFRSYNRRLGRWMSPDPSSLHFASLRNPQTYNLYAYVTNDPLKYIDLRGLQSYCGENDDWDGGDDGCGDGGGGGGWDDPPPTDDPCAYDACVVATPDPPISNDPGDAGDWSIDGVPCDFAGCDYGYTPESGGDSTPTLLFDTHWCGPGGAGTPVNDLDAACMAHDKCYDAHGLSVGSNFNLFISGSQLQALQSCNQDLCDSARSRDKIYGSTEVLLYFQQVPLVGACR